MAINLTRYVEKIITMEKSNKLVLLSTYKGFDVKRLDIYLDVVGKLKTTTS